MVYLDGNKVRAAAANDGITAGPHLNRFSSKQGLCHISLIENTL